MGVPKKCGKQETYADQLYLFPTSNLNDWYNSEKEKKK